MNYQWKNPRNDSPNSSHSAVIGRQSDEQASDAFSNCAPASASLNVAPSSGGKTSDTLATEDSYSEVCQLDPHNIDYKVYGAIQMSERPKGFSEQTKADFEPVEHTQTKENGPKLNLVTATEERTDKTFVGNYEDQQQLTLSQLEAFKEREALVFKLAKFVDSNCRLQEKLEDAHLDIQELRKQLETVKCEKLAVQAKLQDLVTINDQRSSELIRCQASDNAQLLLDNGTSDDATRDLQRQLRECLQVVAVQQKDLKNMHKIIERQQLAIEELLQRQSQTPNKKNLQKAVESSTAFKDERSATTSPKHPSKSAAVLTGANDSKHLARLRAKSDVVSVSSPTTVLQRFNVAPRLVAQPGHRAVDENDIEISRPFVTGAIAERSRSSPLPQRDLKYPPINSCPICSKPIPVEDSSINAFSRHVDDCLLRVTREVPTLTTSPAPTVATGGSDRPTCPVCNMQFPETQFSLSQFEQHVNDHFVDNVVEQFVILDK